jgi:hypothetical protein
LIHSSGRRAILRSTVLLLLLGESG